MPRFNNTHAGSLSPTRQGARRQWLNQIADDANRLGITTRTLRTGRQQITAPDLTAFAKSRGLFVRWEGNTCEIAKPRTPKAA
jgi:hypothetical protein